jgi:ABC-type iron transport system FetAB permease component
MAKSNLSKSSGPGLVGSIVLLVVFLIVAGWLLKFIFKVVWAVVLIVVLITAIPIVAGLVVRSFRRPRL